VRKRKEAKDRRTKRMRIERGESNKEKDEKKGNDFEQSRRKE
jgi:hypothetical protein